MVVIRAFEYDAKLLNIVGEIDLLTSININKSNCETFADTDN